MTMSAWSIARAKARFSSMISDSRKSPQYITKRGKRVAVVLGSKEYEELAGSERSEHPMRRFLETCSRLRKEGDLELTLPRRRRGGARPNPFGGRG